MNVLLDACAMLALARGQLPPAAAAALRRAAEASVSVVSLWEVAIKAERGRLRLPESPIQWYRRVVDLYSLLEIPVDAALVCEAAALPRIHGDPFDRLIVALAQAHALTVLTSDKNIAAYPGVKTVW